MMSAYNHNKRFDLSITHPSHSPVAFGSLIAILSPYVHHHIHDMEMPNLEDI
jgi:hypothetical protein